jgi:hypothetical protein
MLGVDVDGALGVDVDGALGAAVSFTGAVGDGVTFCFCVSCVGSLLGASFDGVPVCFISGDDAFTFVVLVPCAAVSA